MKSKLQSPLVNVLLFSVFWAVEIFITKLAFLAGAQVIPFTLQSIFLTFLILAIYVLPKKLKELRQLPFQTLKWLLIANAIHMGLGSFFSNAGIQLTSAINAGFLMQLTTVTIIIFAWFILREQITRPKIISVLLILIGTFLLVTKGQFIIPRLGDIFIILACITWGLGGVLTRKMLKHTSVSSDIVALLKPVAGIPVLLLFVLLSPFYPSSIQDIFQVNIFEIHQPLLVILNALIISFEWIFYNRTLKFASASYGVILSSLTPILVTLLAFIFLHERLAEVQIFGILLIIASSLVAQYLKFDKH